MVAASITVNRTSSWLRGFPFDGVYVFGTLALALFAGAVVTSNPKLFLPIFVLNGWLLGYHHVISTYTRLTFDLESFRQNRFLVLALPLVVLSAVILITALFGVWILTTLYLYWQWWHYTRQSYGVSRIYARKAGLIQDRLTTGMIYAVPVFGILYRSYQAPKEFLFTEIRVIPVPFSVVLVSGSIAFVIVACWLALQFRAWIRGELAVAHTAYLITHVFAFTTAYVLISDINFGWLVLNVWHNGQYILTVWMFNNNRFKEATSKPALLSYLSQRRNMAMYFGFSLLVSTAVYSSLNFTLSNIPNFYSAAATLPLFAVVYQAINFHHYIIDAVIWKVRKKTLRQNLGIAS